MSDRAKIFTAAVEAYGEEEAAGFMDHSHRGSPAKAVTGNAEEFVNPSALTGEAADRMVAYLKELSAFKAQSALNRDLGL